MMKEEEEEILVYVAKCYSNSADITGVKYSDQLRFSLKFHLWLICKFLCKLLVNWHFRIEIKMKLLFETTIKIGKNEFSFIKSGKSNKDVKEN